MTDSSTGWRALAEHLAEQIQSGKLKPGDRLPTESALQKSTRLSRTTIRTALAELRRRGQIETRAHIGSFVLGLGGAFPLHDGESVTSSAALTVTTVDGSTRTLAAGTRVVAATTGH
jgi:DNA-binding GntR family transcriptional regulator